MEELLELKDLLLSGNTSGALSLIEEMTEMSKDDKLNKIFSFSIILLLHLIKQQAEQRSTRSWEISIRNAVRQIKRINKRRQRGGSYLTTEELRETLTEAYLAALDEASLQAFEGRYDPEEIAEMVEQIAIINQALELILES
ncbi:DUF29 family protein [Gloeocapsa sp. PCC 73106]|uniref:DUF29 family protein n=1 Tax=Gloeocapsa sp. PCC 73106 TaxID=102232 RepID=UPI0002AC31AA|nr:DUF29 family protein [Gloeocapsa sp. PCC 73106]ELR96523.1 protein of unknown function DUF29 [Gloeocapsa sp. PCC 73106]